MKTKWKMLVLSALLLIAAFAVVFFSEKGINSPGADANLPDTFIDGEIDVESEPIPLADTPPLLSMLMPVAAGVDVKKNAKAEIDYSNSIDGYIMIRYTEKSDKQLRILIKGPSGETYTYRLTPNGKFDVFPLSDGNGEYKVGIYENVSGKSYAIVLSAAIQVKLEDELAPFLRPNQYVNYSVNSKTVKKAAELTANTADLLEKILAIYEYVTSNIVYDKELAATVQSGYLPEVDKILESGKGICFDYAAVTTAMLRSQMIPTKLVVGYTGDIYHAWINVYSEQTGWINSIIYFDGTSWKLMDPTLAANNSSEAMIAKYIGDPNNYKAKYLY